MKKNISINIAETLFHIEESGYQLLEEYLTSINAYFSTFDDHKDIIEDIESRISEIFLDKRSTESEVILLSDVESLITIMGTVTDFEASLDTDTIILQVIIPQLRKRGCPRIKLLQMAKKEDSGGIPKINSLEVSPVDLPIILK